MQLDPHNIARVAKALTERLAQLDGAHAEYYQQRAKDFDTRWQAATQRWESQAAPLKGTPIVVMHSDQAICAAGSACSSSPPSSRSLACRRPRAISASS